MAHRKVTTTTREARGRETRLMTDAVPLPLAAALDAIARHHATGEPLERALKDVAVTRKLGPRERRAAGDAAFAWARRREVAQRLVDDALEREGGIKAVRRDRDLCGIVLGLIAAGGEVDARAYERLPAALRAVVDDALVRGITGLPPALPPWLTTLLAASGEDVPALAAGLAKPAPLVLAVDTTRLSVDAARAALDAALKVKKAGGKAVPSPVVDGALRIEGRLALSSLPSEIRAAVWPMDDGSQAVARALDAQAGELVLDLCAGGGGKSRLLSTSGARVVATDVHPERLRAAGDVPKVIADGRAPAFRSATFDRVLVDAPCSGTGTLRRAPDLVHRLAATDIAAFVEMQRALLERALDLVKPGGLVVYATCSLLREENEDVVAHVLKGRRDALAVPIPWRGVHIDGGTGTARLRPHIHGTDGFFVAALKRS